MICESETGLIRPGHKILNGGLTADGRIVIVLEHEGASIRAIVSPVEAETFGCGVIGAAAIARAMKPENRNPIVDRNGESTSPLLVVPK